MAFQLPFHARIELPNSVTDLLVHPGMIWTVRSTRSGKAFSPWGAAAIDVICPAQPFSFGPLLRAAESRETEEITDSEREPAPPVSNKRRRSTSTPPMPNRPPTTYQEPTPQSPKANNHRHQKRRAKREARVLESGQIPSPSTLQKVGNLAKPIETELDTDKLPAAKGGYGAINAIYAGAKVPQTLEHLTQKLGFTLMEWDGR